MIIFIYGQDTYRSRQYLNKLKNKFLSEVDKSGDSLNMIDGSTCDAKEISSITQGASLFVRKRMVVIEDLFLNKKEIIFKQVFDFVKDKNSEDQDDNIIIFWDSLGENEKINKAKKDLFNFLCQTKYSPKPFKKILNMEVTRWIINEFQLQGLKIESRAAMLLGNLAGNDLWQISNEIEKLVNYKKGIEPSSAALSIEVDDIK